MLAYRFSIREILSLVNDKNQSANFGSIDAHVGENARGMHVIEGVLLSLLDCRHIDQLTGISRLDKLPAALDDVTSQR